MTPERRQQAEQVLFGLNPDYIGPECCVKCGINKMTFVAAARNPDGERKGVCARCASTEDTLSYRSGRLSEWMLTTLKKIENGDYD